MSEQCHARLRRDFTCHRGLTVHAERQPDCRWRVGPFFGKTLGMITRIGERHWVATACEGCAESPKRVALWMAVADLCPNAEMKSTT